MQQRALPPIDGRRGGAPPRLPILLGLVIGLAAAAAAGPACRDRARPAAPDAGAAQTAGGVLETAGPPRPPDPAVVRELVVHDLTPEPLRVVDLSGAVDGIVRASLAKTKRVAVAADAAAAPDGYSLGIGVIYQLVVGEQPVTKAEKGMLFVMVEADMGRRHAGGMAEIYEAHALESRPYDPATDGPIEPILRRQTERAVDATRARLVATLRLAGGSDEAVLAMLRDEDPLVRAAAAREAGDRRLAGAVEPLMAALGAEDAELRLAALGALGRIGDRKTAAAVARLTNGMDVNEIRTAVFTLGDIGGPEARRYLESIAYSHPVPEIQAAAKAALGDE